MVTLYIGPAAAVRQIKFTFNNNNNNNNNNNCNSPSSGQNDHINKFTGKNTIFPDETNPMTSPRLFSPISEFPDLSKFSDVQRNRHPCYLLFSSYAAVAANDIQKHLNNQSNSLLQRRNISQANFGGT